MRNVLSQIRQNRIIGSSPMRSASPSPGGPSSFMDPPEPIAKPYRGLFSGEAPTVGAGLPKFNFGETPDFSSDSLGSQSQNSPDNATQFLQAMERLRGNPGKAVSAYQTALGEMPTREDYKPNWLTRIAAGLSGFSAGMRDPGAGVQVASDINTSGYRSAMSDYSNRLGTLKEQADIERDDMKLQLEGLKSAQEAGLNYEKYLDTKRNIDSQVTRRTQQSENEAARLRIEQQKAFDDAKGNWTYTPVQGGMYAQNNKDPSRNQVIKGVGTIQEAQLRVAQGNLALNQQMTEGQLENIASQIVDRESDTGVVSGGEQKSLADVVDDEMSLDPRWNKFYAKKPGLMGFGSSEEQVGPEDFKDRPEVWAAFIAERNARIRRKAQVRR